MKELLLRDCEVYWRRLLERIGVMAQQVGQQEWLQRMKKLHALSFWQEIYKDAPILASLARVVLVAMPTSAPCERTFSKAGRVDTPLRTRLEPAHLQALVYVASNDAFYHAVR